MGDPDAASPNDSSSPAGSAPPVDAATVSRARLLLYASLAIFTFGIGFGSVWDLYWHTQNRFDTFFTPPHLLIYSGVAAAGLLAVVLAFNGALRRCFGQAYKVPLVPFPVPGALMILGGGVAVTLVAGGLDDWWHTTWGQNETRWSLPHAMLAWGIYLAMLGFLSCRLALAKHRPLSGAGKVLLGVLLLAYSMAAYLGPMFLNTSPAAMARLGAMPGFGGAETQHLFRIIAKWDITRANLFYPALAALWAGAGIAVIRGYDTRPYTLIMITGAASVFYAAFGLVAASYVGSGDLGTWMPPLVLAAALLLVWLEKLGVKDLAALALAGALLGLLTALVYNATPLALGLSLLGAATLPAGRWAGAQIYRVVAAPTPARVAWFVPLLGIALPVAVGSLDLYLRLSTA